MCRNLNCRAHPYITYHCSTYFHSEDHSRGPLSSHGSTHSGWRSNAQCLIFYGGFDPLRLLHIVHSLLHCIPTLLPPTSKVPRPLSRFSHRSLASLRVSQPQATIQPDSSPREVWSVCSVWPRQDQYYGGRRHTNCLPERGQIVS